MQTRKTSGPNLYLFDKFDTGEQVHAEIDEGPINTFLLVFLLFEYEHVMVEELLQLFVGEVDTELLETVVLHRWDNIKENIFRFITRNDRENKVFEINPD